MNVRFKLRNEKAKGSTVIYLHYYSSIDKRYFKRYTDTNVTTENWDLDKEQFRGKSCGKSCNNDRQVILFQKK